jgi:hypothetical protein
MVSLKQAMLVGLMVALIAACSGDDEPEEQALTATTEASSVTSLIDSDASGTAAGSETTAPPSTTTTTEPSEISFPEYQIVSREATETGDRVIVLLDTDTYESLSDIDIHNVMSDLVEQFSPVDEAHIVESQLAVEALLADEPTEEQLTELESKYLARLEEGFRIVYLGQLSESGVAILGS